MDSKCLQTHMRTAWSTEETDKSSRAQFVGTGDKEIGECSLPVYRDWSDGLTLTPTCSKVSNGELTGNTAVESDETPLYHSPNPYETYSMERIVPGSKKRAGLVSRTHSPKIMAVVSGTTIENMSDAYPVRASYPHWETGMPLKRRRAKSPKPSFRPNKSQSKTQNRVVKKPRVHDSNGTTSFEESIVSEASNSNVKVKMLMPTISGLDEAARVLRCGTSSLSHGIVSIPTETLYSFSCFVAFRRRKAEVGPSSWKTLNNLVTCERLTTSRPHILLHNSSQAFEMVKFSTPKTFVHKHIKECGSDNNNGATPQVTWRAIKFSESYEVLKRLSSTFWPGTSTIYAPVRLRATKSKADMSDSQDSASTCSSNPPGGSISSLSSESNENKSQLESSCDPSFPILPNSALLSKGELFQERGKEDGTYYVGMRCPSHPLTRRLLANAYSSGNIPHDKSAVRKKPLRGAVVGISPQLHVSKGTRSNSNPVTAEIVRENLASPQHTDTADEQPKATIHVLNGEDTKECFSVPSCQFADSPSASMIIDSPTRTVFIRRERKLPQASPNERSPSDVTAQDVLDVLHQITRQPDEGSAKLRVIDAIMQKWTVVEL